MNPDDLAALLKVHRYQEGTGTPLDKSWARITPVDGSSTPIPVVLNLLSLTPGERYEVDRRAPNTRTIFIRRS